MMISLAGMIVSMGVFIFFSMKRWNVAMISIIASMVLMITNNINPIYGFSNAYSSGLASFASKWWMMFSLGASFGKIMQETGISERIARFFVTKLKCNSVLIILIISLIMSYGGISTFVIAFTIYPIASELFARDNIDNSFMPAVILFCPTTLAMTMLPGTPSIQNIIPVSYLNTDIYAAPLIGIIASIITFSLGYIYFVKKTGIEGNKSNKTQYDLSVTKEADYLCLIPCIGLWAISFVLVKNGIDSQIAVEISLACGIIFCIIIGFKGEKVLYCLNEGVQSGLSTLILTSTVMGYGSLVKSMPVFILITDKLYTIFNNELISSIFAVNVIAALTGSSATSLQLLFDTFSERIVTSSIPLSSVHRIIAIASGGLDSMPYATGVVVANNLASTEQSKTYKHVFFTCALIPLFSLLVSVVLAYILK